MIVSVIVGSDGSVECLSIVNPKHPLCKFIVQTDPAISSYLDETEVSIAGRKPREADGPQHSC